MKCLYTNAWSVDKKQEEELEKLQGDDLSGITGVAHTTRMLPWKLRRADHGLFKDLPGRLSYRTPWREEGSRKCG